MDCLAYGNLVYLNLLENIMNYFIFSSNYFHLILKTMAIIIVIVAIIITAKSFSY